MDVKKINFFFFSNLTFAHSRISLGKESPFGPVWAGVHCLALGDQRLLVASPSRYREKLIPQRKLRHCYKKKKKKRRGEWM